MSYENQLIREAIGERDCDDRCRWCSTCERDAESCVCEELSDHLREVCSGDNPGEDVRVSPASPGQPLMLTYPVWELTFSEYGEKMGWEVPR